MFTAKAFRNREKSAQEKSGKLNISMTARQTPHADEDHVIQLKAPETATVSLVVRCFFSIVIISTG